MQYARFLSFKNNEMKRFVNTKPLRIDHDNTDENQSPPYEQKKKQHQNLRHQLPIKVVGKRSSICVQNEFIK